MNKIVKEAMKINNGEYVPDLEIGEICEMNDLWDGNGEFPEGSYSIQLGEYDDPCPQWIDYEFEIVEEKENELDTLIKITDIRIL